KCRGKDWWLMIIELRKLKRDKYDLLLDSINENVDFYKGNTDILIIDNQGYTLEDLSEPLSNSHSNNKIVIKKDSLEIQHLLKWKQNYEIGKLLYNQLAKYTEKYFGLLSEDYFWAYLAHMEPFRKYI